MQPVVVDTEVVGDLVNHGDPDLVDDLVFAVADVQQRVAIDRDGVGQRTGVVGITFGQRHALVQAEQVGFLRVTVGDQHHYVVHHGSQPRRDQVERVGHQLV